MSVAFRTGRAARDVPEPGGEWGGRRAFAGGSLRKNVTRSGLRISQAIKVPPVASAVSRSRPAPARDLLREPEIEANSRGPREGGDGDGRIAARDARGAGRCTKC